jgi:hypothetical protein
MSESEDMRRIGMNEEEDVEAHLRRVNDEPVDELRRETDDDDEGVEAHLKRN